MGFKKKQFFGFGLILLLMLLLLTVAIMMLNILKSNMDEITTDRFGKVDQITEIREIVYTIDSEMAMLLSSQTKVLQHLDSLEAERRTASLQIENLKRVVNTPEGNILVKKLEADFNKYKAIQLEFIELVQQENWDRASQVFREKNQEAVILLIQTTSDFIALQKDLLIKRTISYEKAHSFTISIIVAASLFFIILSIFIAFWVIRSTTNNLIQVIDRMNQVDVSLPGSLPRLNITTDDEIGTISKAFNRMVQQLEDYRNNEKDYNVKMEQQNWLQTQIAEVATMYQGIMNLTSLAKCFINKATPLVGAVYSVLYMAKSSGTQLRYEKLASYAADGVDAGQLTIVPGQGLVGQCALDQRMMRLDDVPTDYVKISSGLGTSPVKHVLIAPILFEGRTVAVVEFASLTRFSEMDEALIISLTDRMGVTVDNISGRMEVERLLIESQSLTEELQSQSEELHKQAIEMQSQSEELQMQSEELMISNEQLEFRNGLILQRAEEVNRIRRELEEKNKDLEQSSLYKTEFLANMSHELRTPLNSILILSQMIMENRLGSLPSEKEEFAQVIYNSGKDLLNLINDILDLSKVEAGKMTLELQDVSVHEVPNVLSWNFGPLAEKKNLQLIIEVDPNVPTIIQTDEQRLLQILKNLLSNAIKFTELGSITIKVYQPSLSEMGKAALYTENHMRAATYQINMEDQLDQLADYVAFAIIDTGIGVAKSKQNLIFEAFRQADGATSRRYGGTGLGLSICREFASLLRGYIGIESEEGKGSAFIFYVPIRYPELLNNELSADLLETNTDVEMEQQGSKDHTMREVEFAAQQTGAGMNDENELFNNKRVLIVDDDVRNVYAVTAALEHQGMTVKTALNGREALDELKRDAGYDLILMDIMMPEMDGYETMKTIRGQLGIEKIPILAITAKAMKGDRQKCLEAGASDYISKPLNIHQLFSLMRVWIV
ncbi:MAG: response regulator [Gorillibacterium sp.]|nr:response regulator [Gorillibacterium sp.]